MSTTTAHAEWHGKLARRYLIQLCKHFQHRIPVTVEEGDPATASGTIAFEAGTCALHAEAEVLAFTVSAPDAESLAKVEDVVSRHFERFAFREEVKLAWQPA